MLPVDKNNLLFLNKNKLFILKKKKKTELAQLFGLGMLIDLAQGQNRSQFSKRKK